MTKEVEGSRPFGHLVIRNSFGFRISGFGLPHERLDPREDRHGDGEDGGDDHRRWALAGDQLYVDLDISEANLPPGTRLQIGEAGQHLGVVLRQGPGQGRRPGDARAAGIPDDDPRQSGSVALADHRGARRRVARVGTARARTLRAVARRIGRERSGDVPAAGGSPRHFDPARREGRHRRVRRPQKDSPDRVLADLHHN